MITIPEIVSRLQVLSGNGLPFAYADVISGCGNIVETEAEFIKLYKEDGRIDFVYDQRLQMFFCYLTYTSHETLMRVLYEHYTADLSLRTWDAADKYIIDGHGMFKSRAALHGSVMHGHMFPMSTELRMALRMDLEELT